jgi:hypothetical protein
LKCHDGAPDEGNRFSQVDEEFAVSLHKIMALVEAHDRRLALVLQTGAAPEEGRLCANQSWRLLCQGERIAPDQLVGAHQGETLQLAHMGPTNRKQFSAFVFNDPSVDLRQGFRNSSAKGASKSSWVLIAPSRPPG